MDDRYLTLREGASLLRLATPETFARFARRHGIPLVKFGSRLVLVRERDLTRAIDAHRVAGPASRDSKSGRRAA